MASTSQRLVNIVLYLAPVGLLFREQAQSALSLGLAYPLLGGPIAFTACDVIVREKTIITSSILTLSSICTWAAHHGLMQEVFDSLDRLSSPLPPFAGLSLARPRLMGVVNVSPDSFFYGSVFTDTRLALQHALSLKEAGADIIDIGGESTRPGAQPISPEEEMERVLPLVQSLAEYGILTSVDTRHSTVMAAALDAGATIINDITALTGDSESLSLLASRKKPVILMHMQGSPSNMQHNPKYHSAPLDIYDALAERVANCLDFGVTRDNICLDPGIGFGKTTVHNLDIISKLAMFHSLGCGLLLGVSRKSFIAEVSATEGPQDRLPGSLAAAMIGLDQGVSILRVHDVVETRQLIKVWQAARSNFSGQR